MNLRIYTCVHSYDGGQHIFASVVQERIRPWLAGLCREYWFDRSISAPENCDGLTDDAVIEAYFNEHDCEFYTEDFIDCPIDTEAAAGILKSAMEV